MPRECRDSASSSSRCRDERFRPSAGAATHVPSRRRLSAVFAACFHRFWAPAATARNPTRPTCPMSAVCLRQRSAARPPLPDCLPWSNPIGTLLCDGCLRCTDSRRQKRPDAARPVDANSNSENRGAALSPLGKLRPHCCDCSRVADFGNPFRIGRRPIALASVVATSGSNDMPIKPRQCHPRWGCKSKGSCVASGWRAVLGRRAGRGFFLVAFSAPASQ